MSVWNYLITGVCSVFVGVFTLHHSGLQVKKEREFSSGKEILYIAVNTILWFFLTCFFDFSFEFLIAALTTSALVGLSAVDFEIYEIPVEFNWFLLALGVIHTFMNLQDWLLYVIGFFAVSTIFLIISIATKGNGMGGGDIKLMATLGLLLGWKKILLVMVLGSVLGVLIHGLVMLIKRKEHVLAFGPYLSMAAYISMCFGDIMIQWYLQTFFQLQK